MAVDTSVIDKFGKETKTKRSGCFGPWYNKNRVAELYGVHVKHIKYLKFFPMPVATSGQFTLNWREINSYLRLIEHVGVRTVLEFPHKRMLSSNYLEGVCVDMTKHSGQAAIGALELVRNIAFRPDFCRLVVRLWRAGVSPEVALFIPRFFKTFPELNPPAADTTSYNYDGLTKLGHKLFTKKDSEREKIYQPWVVTGTFDGVFKYYAGKDKLYIPCCLVPYLRGRNSLLLNAVHEEGGSNFYSKLCEIYATKQLSFEQLVKVAKHYDVTGELPTTIEEPA